MSISLNREEAAVVPDWYSYFCETEYSAFIESIDNYFERMNLKFRITAGNLYVEKEEDDPVFDKLDLADLAQVCKQYNNMYYDEIVRSHFNSLLREYAYTIMKGNAAD